MASANADGYFWDEIPRDILTKLIDALHFLEQDGRYNPL
jgi:hypothetical protein